ncbi:hypothetical protein EV426DRAFT_79816 [Tirmania nivea]|nr:hypothetical protein EV426DRAFT_79816 [Tirmania nivea]
MTPSKKPPSPYSSSRPTGDTGPPLPRCGITSLRHSPLQHRDIEPEDCRPAHKLINPVHGPPHRYRHPHHPHLLPPSSTTNPNPILSAPRALPPALCLSVMGIGLLLLLLLLLLMARRGNSSCPVPLLLGVFVEGNVFLCELDCGRWAAEHGFDADSRRKWRGRTLALV